jgi:hypothetical protein
MFQAGYARSMDNNAVILQTKEATLTADKFIYQGTTYPVNTMKAASLKEGNYKSPDKLQIEFKDGTTREFYFQPTVTFKEIIAERLSNYKLTPMNHIQCKMATQILEWATNVNELINQENK